MSGRRSSLLRCWPGMIVLIAIVACAAVLVVMVPNERAALYQAKVTNKPVTMNSKLVQLGLAVAIPDGSFRGESSTNPMQVQQSDVLLLGSPAVLAATAITVAVTNAGVVLGKVTDDASVPVAGAMVTIVATSPDESDIHDSAVTDEQGEYTKSLNLGSGTWTITASSGIATGTATVTMDSALSVSASQPLTLSETRSTLTVHVTDRNQPAKGTVTVAMKEPTDGDFAIIGTASASVAGVAKFSVRPWRNPQYRVTVARKGAVATITVVGPTTAPFAEVVPPRNAPEPHVRQPMVMPPSGAGAAATVRPVSGPVWRSMVGVSWRPGCPPRSRLRMVDVNYRGYDGYRHRGRLIVARAIGGKTKQIFTRLLQVKYPIRSIQPADYFGKNPGRWPGANDRASMAADNTSGFNCRYVVGREPERALSPHASGRSIDINTWINPYVSPRGIFPNAYYLDRRKEHPALLKRANQGLRAFQRNGCRWGASFRDFQHFDC